MLGALFDPLGLFRSSRLIVIDNYDEKVLDSARKVIKVLTESLSNFPIPDPLALISSGDLQKILNSLSFKLWKNRENISKFGTELFLQVIDDSLYRIEYKPESSNESLKSENIDSPIKINILQASSEKIPVSYSPGNTRLETARKLLREIDK